MCIVKCIFSDQIIFMVHIPCKQHKYKLVTWMGDSVYGLVLLPACLSVLFSFLRSFIDNTKNPKNEDDPKNKDDTKNEDDPKRKEKPKNVDYPKNEDDPKK